MKNLNLDQILRKYADTFRYTIDHWLNGLPSVTILCPTFGRPYLLNEAVESFLKQDYEGELKVLILNDQPNLKIKSEIDRITVINKKERYITLAEKRKDLIKMGDTDLCMLCGDDDILMPWAVSAAVSAMVSHFLFIILGHVKYNYGNNIATYYPKAPLPGPMLFNNSIAKKADLVQSHDPPGFELQLIDSLKKYIPDRMGALINNQSKKLPSDKVYYMARTNLPHYMSVNRNGYKKCGAFVESLNFPPSFIINPKWERDYISIFKKAISEKV